MSKGNWVRTARQHAELSYVVDGDFRFKAGDAMFRVYTGGMAFGPRGPDMPMCVRREAALRQV